MPRLRDIRRRFDRAAATFDDADFVHAVTRDGVVSRLEPLVIEPTTILDLGCATGSMGRVLRKRFRRAHVVSLDLSHVMLGRARKKRSWFARSSFVQGDASQLPFADASFELVIANQLLPLVSEPQPVFEEVSRILRKDGVFTFATLGPDSLQEIGRAWASVDDMPHVISFPDMHDIGDGLVRAGLRDPVLDVDRLLISYDKADKLFTDLSRAGARNVLSGRGSNLTGKGKFRGMTESLSASGPGDKIVLDLELVYGHCWGSGRCNDPANYHIDAARIPLRR
jgi:malonyl-CoA O-methyltransferase